MPLQANDFSMLLIFVANTMLLIFLCICITPRQRAEVRVSFEFFRNSN